MFSFVFAIRHRHLFGIGLIVWTLLGCAGSESHQRKELEAQFRDEFGFTPPTFVSNIQCKVVRVGDTWGKWLAFSYEASTFKTITNQSFNSLNPATSSDLGRFIWSADLLNQNPNRPEWWEGPSLEGKDTIYYKEGDVRNFNRSYTFLWLNSSNKTVYVRAAAWD
jgi:hypothetical protein